jgi:hypothetical protein
MKARTLLDRLIETLPPRWPILTEIRFTNQEPELPNKKFKVGDRVILAKPVMPVNREWENQVAIVMKIHPREEGDLNDPEPIMVNIEFQDGMDFDISENDIELCWDQTRHPFDAIPEPPRG